MENTPNPTIIGALQEIFRHRMTAWELAELLIRLDDEDGAGVGEITGFGRVEILKSIDEHLRQMNGGLDAIQKAIGADKPLFHYDVKQIENQSEESNHERDIDH